MRIYRGNGWTIINGKWEDADLAEVDTVISDPPYDERTHRGGRKGLGWKGKDKGHRKICEVAPISFPPVDPVDVGPHLVKLAKRWVILFCAVEQLGHYQAALGDSYIRSGLWVKANPTPQFTGDRPGQWGDAIAVCHRKGSKRWNGGGHSLVFNEGTVGRNNNAGGGAGSRLHETEKPVSIMLRLVRLFSDPGETVLDPYCGSGTTGIACLRLGREFIGYEMQPRILASKTLPDGRKVWLERPHDKPYARIAAERLAAEERGLTVQAARSGQMSIIDAMENTAPP